MATLLVKVFALTLKTVAKPLANRFEAYVMGHPRFRQSIVNFAQRLHRLEISINRGAEGKAGGRVFVGDMTEEKAVQLASKVASEGFVYFIGLTAIALELERKRREDVEKKSKEDARRKEIRALHQQHLRAETELRAATSSMVAILDAIDERLKRMEVAVAMMESNTEQQAQLAGAAAAAAAAQERVDDAVLAAVEKTLDAASSD